MSRLTRPRWTHVALPSLDLDRTVAWYQEFTPLVPIAWFEDDAGRAAWMSHEGQADPPFVLVLVMFHADAGTPQPQLSPFAHIGVEVPERADVDAIAARAEAAGCLVMPPQDVPYPVGYVCMIADPDGNRIEISHDQLVYQRTQELWGAAGGG